jgi:hypothetical protein
MNSQTVSVGTTSTLIVAPQGSASDPELIWLRVITAAKEVFIGGDPITVADGLMIKLEDGVLGPWELRDGQSIYGIVAATTADVRVMRTHEVQAT